MSIKIVIDSASDITKEEADKLGIVLLPMEVTFGNESYLDGVTLSHSEFFSKLENSTENPKTSQINSFRWGEAFEEIVSNGDEVIAITMSSKLSGTYNSACSAATEFKDKVRVVDSNTVTLGERFFALYALRLIEKNMSLNEIEKELNKKRGKVFVLAVMGTLEYLKRGGRISTAAALVGKLLAIKPLIGIIDGEVKVIGKAIGAKNGVNLLNKMIKEKDLDLTLPHGTIWSGLDKSVLTNYLSMSSDIWNNYKDMPEYYLGATIGTHIGPGAVGVGFFVK